MRKMPGSTSRCVALAAALLPLAAIACLTPKDDYDDFVARTADARAALSVVPVVEAGPFEAALPEGGFGGTYFLSCLPTLAGGDVTKTLNFQATFELLPAADGGSTATLSATALVVGATDLSQTVGAADTGSGTLDANGVGDVIIPAAIDIPGAANPISPGMDVMIAPGADLRFYVTSATNLCTGLGASITAPLVLKLTANATPCIMQPFAQPSGPLPALVAADYHCP